MRPCPACGAEGPFPKVEDWHDAVGGKDYAVHACPSCGVEFSEPRVAVGADWYEKAAPLRGREYKPGPETDFRFKLFFAEPLTPGRLLDVGCGDGGFLALAKDRGWSVTGFDYDARMVAQARARGVDAHASDFESFCRGRAAGEFDAATLYDVLEHTPEPGALLEQVKRLLRKGGHLALTLPNNRRPIPFRREAHDYPPHHFTRWTPEAMRTFLEKNGFAVERQVAGELRWEYVSDHLFFFGVMPWLLGAAKRVLFGRKASTTATVSDLYSRGTAASEETKGTLADPLVRARLVEWARTLFRAGTFPLAVLLTAYYRATRELAGDSLYTLARRVD
jgi:SAM-dependent methyltransferase